MAGRKRGQEDDRYLWPAFKKLIGDIRPDFVVCENVSGIIKSASDTVCKDLESEGYSVRIFNFEATAVGAFHRRDRVFFVAHRKDLALMEDSGCKLLQRSLIGGEVTDEGREGTAYIPERSGEARAISVSNPNSIRCNMRGSKRQGIYGAEQALDEADSGGKALPAPAGSQGDEGWLESRMGGMVDGVAYELDETGLMGIDENYINLHYWVSVPEPKERVKQEVPDRVDQLRALGNAVVPQQIYPIFKAIIDVFRRLDRNENDDIITLHNKR